MPVIRPVPQNPFDFVMQGEQFRAEAFQTPVSFGPSQTPILTGFSEAQNSAMSFLIADDDEEDVGMMPDGIMPNPRLAPPGVGVQIRANACIATQMGNFVDLNRGIPIINPFVQSTEIFTITGQTLTGAGAPIGNCRLMVFETGRLEAGEGESEATEGYSDGSGNFSLTLPMNTHYQMTGYLSGSPDLAGITRNNITPGSVNIYMRDPTAPDVAGAAVYRVIGSPVVRRIQ